MMSLMCCSVISCTDTTMYVSLVVFVLISQPSYVAIQCLCVP